VALRRASSTPHLVLPSQLRVRPSRQTYTTPFPPIRWKTQWWWPSGLIPSGCRVLRNRRVCSSVRLQQRPRRRQEAVGDGFSQATAYACRVSESSTGSEERHLRLPVFGTSPTACRSLRQSKPSIGASPTPNCSLAFESRRSHFGCRTPSQRQSSRSRHHQRNGVANHRAGARGVLHLPRQRCAD